MMLAVSMSRSSLCQYRAPVVGHRACHAGGREFDSGRTNAQGLKITEKKVLPLQLHPQMVKTFKSSRIRTINRRPRLTTLECSQAGGT